MTKIERIRAVLNRASVDYVPTGFWIHFTEDCFFGDAAVNAHLEFFDKTESDLCKVMTEWTYPCDGSIKAASDWKLIKSYKRDASFIQNQANLISSVAEKCNDSPIVATLHGVVASASHALLGIPRYDSIGRYAQLYHLRTDRQSVYEGYRRIADTLKNMAREFVKAGAIGIYYAALGGEADGFTDEEHAEYIAPLDKEIIHAAYDAGAEFVILHMCKPKVRLERFLGYDADIVNWGVRESGIPLSKGRELFPDKILLGGLDHREGALISGDIYELEKGISSIFAEVGTGGLILGSDCTLPTGIPYSNIRAVSEISKRLSDCALTRCVNV